ncbi:DUF4352 domain-containing protein [Bacillus sp. OTU530]|uniref:DUF4352 domain-containing protein n=1 Tax=Bacillus sp. OTU530 TaxID=3043862 RepID=UPI00313C64CF
MAKLVNCKACDKEIAKGVKKCVHCGKDQRNFFGRHKFLSGIGALVIIGIIIGAASGGKEATTTSGTAVTEQAAKVFKLNETFKADNVEYNVAKVEEKSEVGNDVINKKASNGGTFVAIEYTVKNVGTKPVNPFSINQARLVDEKGTEYKPDIDATSTHQTATGLDNSKFASDLNPNIQVTDQEVFEVSKDAYAAGKWYVQIGETKVEIK